LTLERENAGIRSKNRGLKIGLGISSGTAGALIIVLSILFCKGNNRR
jgi:hypothetical protein